MPLKKVKYAKKTHKKRMPKSKTNLVKLIKRVTLKQSEPKYTAKDWGKTEMYHNLYTTFHINANTWYPSEGTGDDNRVGDRIYQTGICLRMLLGQKADRHNVTFKMFVIQVPKGVSFSYSGWFRDITSNTLLDPVNTDLCKVIYHKTIKKIIRPDLSGVGGADKELTFPHKVWIPRRKLIKFQQDGGTAHNDNDLYFIICPYDAYGTLQTDNISYIEMTQTIHYRDP